MVSCIAYFLLSESHQKLTSAKFPSEADRVLHSSWCAGGLLLYFRSIASLPDAILSGYNNRGYSDSQTPGSRCGQFGRQLAHTRGSSTLLHLQASQARVDVVRDTGYGYCSSQDQFLRRKAGTTSDFLFLVAETGGGSVRTNLIRSVRQSDEGPKNARSERVELSRATPWDRHSLDSNLLWF